MAGESIRLAIDPLPFNPLPVVLSGKREGIQGWVISL